MEPLSTAAPFAFLAPPPSLWQVLGLALGIVVAIVLTLVVVLAILSLIAGGSLMAFGKLRRLIFPALAAKDDARTVGKSDTPATLLQQQVRYFREKQTAHVETVVSLGVSTDGNLVVSAGRDRTLRFWERETDNAQTVAIPFFPGPIVVRQHASGPRVALGVFDKDDANADDVLIWEPLAAGTEPTFRLRVPGVHHVFALAWDASAERLRVLASVYDATRPLAPNGSSDSPNHITLLEFAVDNGGSVPTTLTLPPEANEGTFWSLTDSDKLALSRNGRWLVCRTVADEADEKGAQHGVGVWDVDREAWRHRWGGREAQPHEIHYVTEDGDLVFTTREDDPKRDFRNGGPEWYDGVYVWDTASPPEGTDEVRPHPTMHGGRGMVMNHTEILSTASTSTGSVDICDVLSRTVRQTVSRPATGDPAHPYGNNVWEKAFSDATGEFITGHADGQLWIWNLKT